MVNLDEFQTSDYNSEFKLFYITTWHRLTWKHVDTLKPIYTHMHTHMCVVKQYLLLLHVIFSDISFSLIILTH